MVNWEIFSVGLVPQYLAFHIYHVSVPVYLSTNKHSTQNNEQFDVDIINMALLLGI